MAKQTSTKKNAKAKASTPKAEVTVPTCSSKGCDVSGAENFSPLKSGGFSSYCKSCNVAKSKAWTESRADLRQAQMTARKYISNGIPAIIPDAKTWQPSDVIMTYEYKGTDGKVVKSQPAEPLYQAVVAERTRLREEAKALKQQLIDEQKELRAQEREAKKAERAAEKEAVRLAKQKEREAKAEAKAKAKALKQQEQAEARRKEVEAKAKAKRKEILEQTQRIKAKREAAAESLAEVQNS